MLGLIAGLLAGLLIVAFRFAVTAVQQMYMPGLPGEAFEWLDPWERFLVPTAGGVVLGLIVGTLPRAVRTVGIVHVLERLHYHQGYMPWRNMLWQFFGGALALASGQSVGREAPSVHLGAAAASLMGRWLALPNNCIRTLIACGAAAAIAASFNTPLAGVVFAMEVVMVEYTIAGFVPVILAAVAATAITRTVFGDDTAFLVPLLGLASLTELVYITVMGALIGVGAALFTRAIRLLGRLTGSVPEGLRLSLAGALVGAIAVFFPAVLGLGYDSVNVALAGQLGVGAMAALFVAKFCASAISVAARIPGGVIGPSVVLGSLAGGGFGVAAAALVPDSSAALYVMLGMAAMMGAVLQAPLAALLALLEMTGNALVIMPAMLAVVSASLTARIVFAHESVFTTMLRDAGLDYRHDPVTQGLSRLGVAAVMTKSFEQCPRQLTMEAAAEILQRGPRWLIVDADTPEPLLMRAADLARYCEATGLETAETGERIDLLAIPAERFELRPVHREATLFEAREAMRVEGVEALYVRRQQAPMTFKTFGIVHREDLESGYEFRA